MPEPVLIDPDYQPLLQTGHSTDPSRISRGRCLSRIESNAVMWVQAAVPGNDG